MYIIYKYTNIKGVTTPSCLLTNKIFNNKIKALKFIKKYLKLLIKQNIRMTRASYLTVNGPTKIYELTFFTEKDIQEIYVLVKMTK